MLGARLTAARIRHAVVVSHVVELHVFVVFSTGDRLGIFAGYVVGHLEHRVFRGRGFCCAAQCGAVRGVRGDVLSGAQGTAVAWA